MLVVFWQALRLAACALLRVPCCVCLADCALLIVRRQVAVAGAPCGLGEGVTSSCESFVLRGGLLQVQELVADGVISASALRNELQDVRPMTTVLRV